MARTIRVTGKGKISLKPDTIRLVITQQSVEKSYEKAIRESAEKKEDLNESIEELGFEKSDIKTLYFNVDTEYQSYQAKDGSWRRRFLGYRYTHRMKFEFPSDNKILGRVLMAIAKLEGKPEFSIEYTVADTEAAKNELLAKAVEDSMAKAQVLSRAAGVSLGDIQVIDYSWGEIEFVTKPVNDLMLGDSRGACMNMVADSIDLDIEADDIDVTDTVTVVWEIS